MVAQVNPPREESQIDNEEWAVKTLAISVNRWRPLTMLLNEILNQTGWLGWGSKNVPPGSDSGLGT